MARVKLAGVLIPLAGGRTELEVEGKTVGEVLENLAKLSRKLHDRIMSPDGRLKPDIYIAVNDVDVRLLSGLQTPVDDRDLLLLLAYIHPG